MRVGERHFHVASVLGVEQRATRSALGVRNLHLSWTAGDTGRALDVRKLDFLDRMASWGWGRPASSISWIAWRATPSHTLSKQASTQQEAGHERSV